MAEKETEATTAPSPNGGAKKSPAPNEPVAIRKVDKSPPKKPLPTNRIAFAKQLEILRAFSAASGDTRKAVGLNEVSSLTKIASDTLSLANRFFLPVGLISKTDMKFTPSTAVREFALSVQWGDESAAHKLAPQLATGWFWQVLEPYLRMGALQEGEVINKLALAAEATKEYQPQILVLLNYLDACGLIQREGKTIRLGPASSATVAKTPSVSAAEAASEVSLDTGDESSQAPAQRQPQGSLSTAFSQEPEGALRVMVSINVSMSELREWPADRVASLLNGVAQMLTAKAAAEKESARDS